MNAIADIYSKQKYRIRITTSLKPFIQALNKSKDWQCKRFGRVGKSRTGKIENSNNRVTASFQYKGNNV